MSDAEERIKRLEFLTRKSKVFHEEAKKRLEEVNMKIAQLFTNREISHKDYSKIISRITGPSYPIVVEDILPSQLDNVAKFADVRTTAPLFAIDETLKSREWIDLITVLKELGFPLNTLFEKPLPSVDIAGTRRMEQLVSKAIDNLLYTYTPFKLRGSKPEYVILLLPSTRRNNIEKSWFSTETNYFYDDGIKVITPDEIRPVRISDLRQMIYVDGEQFFRFEIDSRVTYGTYYCKMGFYISPKRSCSRHNCYLWDACEGRRFWKGPRSFYSIAKVAPNLVVKIDNYTNVEKLAQFANGLLTFERIDELLAKIFIGSVTFLSRYMVRNPLIKLSETVGYRINTRSIALAVDANWLKEFVEDVLQKDETVFTWIYTKYFIHENFDVNDVRRLASFFWDLIRSKKSARVNKFVRGLQARKITEDLVSFASIVLLHSLSHLLHEEIVAKLQTSSDNIVYAYCRRPENDGKYRIFLFENAERGLGLTESFAAHIEKVGSRIMIDIIDKMSEIQLPCYRASLMSQISLQDVSKAVRTILTHLENYNRALQTTYGISVPVEIARYILAREDRDTSKLIDREDVSAYMDDILSSSPLCWDGCYQCVRLELDCHEPPYEQMFSVSKSLLTALLNRWREIINKEFPPSPTPSGVRQTIVEIGEAKNLFNYIKQAETSVKITSPWISQQVAKDICNLATKKGILFQILTSLDKTVDTHRKALKVFEKANVPNIQVRALEDRQLHAKMVIVDEKLLIIGSANLTLSGLYENIEGYAVLMNHQALRDSLFKFFGLWNYATPLDQII